MILPWSHHPKKDFEIHYTITYTFTNPFGKGNISIKYLNLTSEETNWSEDIRNSLHPVSDLR